MKKDALVQSFGRAAATTAYIALVATLLSNGEQIFTRTEKTVLIPIFMLLLFVISATITSFLVLGKPVMLYQAGDKKGAFAFLFATVGWLLSFLLLVALIMASMG